MYEQKESRRPHSAGHPAQPKPSSPIVTADGELVDPDERPSTAYVAIVSMRDGRSVRRRVYLSAQAAHAHVERARGRGLEATVEFFDLRSIGGGR